MTDNESQDKSSELRSRENQSAVERSPLVPDISSLPPEKMQQLIRQMQARQVELERQNEELRGINRDLEASRDRLAESHDLGPVGCFSLDPDGMIVEVNLAGAYLTGIQRDLLIGRPLADFVSEEDEAPLCLHIGQVFETQAEQTCDIRMLRGDGNQVSVRLHSHVQRDRDGSPTGLGTAAIDVTEGKRAKEIVHASELRYRRLFESTKDGILIVDFDSSQIVDVNPQLIDLLGYSREEFVGKHLLEAAPFQRTAAGKNLVAELQEKGSASRKDLSLESKSGLIIDVEFVSNSFLINGKTFIQCNMRKSDQAWVQIFNAISDGVMIVDDQHRIVRMNTAMAGALGITDEEAIGRSCFELVHGETEPPQFCPHASFLADRKKHSAVVFEPRLGGVYDVRVFPLFDQDGQRQRSVHIVRDITEKKRTEKKIRQQSEFLRNVLNSLTHPFYVVDASDFTVTVANRAAGLRGITVGQKCYAAAKGRTSPCSGPEHRCPVTEVKQTGKPATAEHVHLYEETSPRNVEVHAYPILNAEGEVSQVIEYVLDITERKRAEEALERRIIALTRPLGETEGISFEDLFNLDEIQKLQDQFAKAANVGSLITLPDGTPITKPSNFCRLCMDIIRKTEVGERNCQHSDATIGRYNSDGPNIQSCLSAGLCNAGSSISVGGRHIANWLIGQVRNETQDVDATRAYARAIGVDEEEFLEAYQEVPFMSQEQFSSVAQAMHTVAQQLSNTAYQNVQQARFIAERKSAEAALRESEQKLRLFIEQAPTALAMFDSEMRYLAASKLWINDYDVGDRPIIGQPHYEISPWIPDRWKAAHRRALEGEVVRAEEDFVTEKGGIGQWRRWEVQPWYTAEGGIGGIVIFAEDITERKQAEEARLASERRYRNLFEESRDGVYAILREGEIIDANPAVCEMFGYDREELIGQNARDLYANPADRLVFQREIEKQGFVKDYEIRFRKKDGTEVDCLLTASVEYGDDGSILGYRGIMRDLTTRKRLQNQLLQAQKMEAIGTLAGGIAHDFNNLLQVVLGYTDMLIMQEAKESPDLRPLKAIQKAAKDGGELAKGLLTFSRRVETSKVPVDLTQTLTHFRKLVRRVIPKTIEIKLILASDLATVNADAIQMGQVLMNLAINAHHAMPKGGKLTIEGRNVTLDEDYCRANVEAKPGEHVMLTISDSGHGMEKNVLDHIFEPFFTTKQAGEGTGLGLSIVYGIVKNHDGHITCHSEPGRGTTFSIYLPVATTESRPEDIVTTTEEMTAFGTESILIVDDEQPIRKAAEQILASLGYGVWTAADGNKALEIYRKNWDNIDLVILDLNMPGMDGTEVLEAILRIDPGARVLVASGYPLDESKRQILEAARGFIGKPFDARDLLRAIRRVLDETGSPRSRAGRSGLVSVQSHESEGTSGTRGQSPGAAAPAHKAPDIEKSARRLRILAIDDREPYLRMLEAGLVQFGQTPITASSGTQGLQKFLETPVDVVVCDLDMPELDGWGVGKGIKEICEERSSPRPPFVLLTGESSMGDMDEPTGQRMADCGVDAIVEKPVDIPDLLEIIRGLMGRLQGIND